MSSTSQKLAPPPEPTGVQRPRRACAAAVELIAAGKVMPKRNGKAPTLRELGRRWTSGELALEHPDHVKEKSSAGMM
jgi:hypothetical protein